MNIIEDIIISNCYPSDEELRKISTLNLTKLVLDVELVDAIPEIERKIVLEENHFNRGDQSEYFVRLTQSRVKYKGHQFDTFNTPDIIKRGDL